MELIEKIRRRVNAGVECVLSPKETKELIEYIDLIDKNQEIKLEISQNTNHCMLNKLFGRMNK